MNFDDCLEDEQQSFQCPRCGPEICSSAKKDESGFWSCDTCDFSIPDNATETIDACTRCDGSGLTTIFNYDGNGSDADDQLCPVCTEIPGDHAEHAAMRTSKIRTACKHMEFDAVVGVARIEDKGRFMAEIKIKCRDCGVPMQFMGLEPGLNFDGATVSLDGLEMNVGIHPQGNRPNPMQKLMGYSIKQHN